MRLVCLDLKGHCICCTQQLFHYSVEGMSVWVSFLQFSRLDDNQPRPNGEKYLKFKRLKSNLMIEIKYETQKLLKVLFSLNVLWTVVKVNEELCFFHRIKIFIKFWRIVICQKKIWVQRRHTPNMKNLSQINFWSNVKWYCLKKQNWCDNEIIKDSDWFPYQFYSTVRYFAIFSIILLRIFSNLYFSFNISYKSKACLTVLHLKINF